MGRDLHFKVTEDVIVQGDSFELNRQTIEEFCIWKIME